MASVESRVTAKSHLFDGSKILTPPDKKDAYLGGGAFGVVYKCHEKALRMVAVKVITADLHHISDELKESAKREAKFALQANHANVVQFYGMTSLPMGLGLVMEYMPNGTLLTLLGRHNESMSWSFKIRMCDEIANGLAFLHSMDIDGKNTIHGDLKPANILLDADYHGKLSDFGSATTTTVSCTCTHGSSATHLHTLGYSPMYCCPERLLNPYYKPKESCDIFSLAMTIYQVVFGDLPLGTGDIANLKKEREDGIRPPLDEKKGLLEQATSDDKYIINKLIDICEICWKTQEGARMSSIEARDQIAETYAEKARDVDIEKTIAIFRSHREKPKREIISEWISLKSALTGGHDNQEKPEKRLHKPCTRLPSLPTESNNSGCQKLGVEIDKAKDVVMEGDKRQIKMVFDNLDTMVRSSASGVSASDIFGYAQSLLNSAKLLEAALAYRLVSQAFLKEERVNEEDIHMVKHCAAKTKEIGLILNKREDENLRQVIKNIFPQCINCILVDICRMRGNKVDRVVNYAWCCKSLAELYEAFCMPQEQCQEILRGIKLMNDGIGEERSSEFRIFGYLHHCLGIILAESIDFARAKSVFAIAECYMKNARDWKSEDEEEAAFAANTSAFENACQQESLLKVAKGAECKIS